MISDLGKNIQRIRTKRNISLNKLARISSVSGSTISKVEMVLLMI